MLGKTAEGEVGDAPAAGNVQLRQIQLTQPLNMIKYVSRYGCNRFKWPVSSFKNNIFMVDYTSVSPKKYFAKDLDLC